MDQKELKTSIKQRIFIIIIAILMVGSMIASYIAIVLNGSSASSSNTTDETTEVDEEKIAEYEEAYNKIKDEFSEATKDDFDEFQEQSDLLAARFVALKIDISDSIKPLENELAVFHEFYKYNDYKSNDDAIIQGLLDVKFSENLLQGGCN